MEYTAPPLILVIEDEAAIAALLCELLQEHGYRCLHAGGAESALRLLETRSPDLITLDLGLPGVSGASLLQMLRVNRPTRHTPVVVVSAERVIDAQVRAASQAVVTKPFDVDRLLGAIDAILGGSPGQMREVRSDQAWRQPRVESRGDSAGPASD